MNFDFTGHTTGDEECKGCANETYCGTANEPYKCDQKDCTGTVHWVFIGEGFDPDTYDCWGEYDQACDICGRED